ncbi:hypothetical protein [Streptomyces sp. NPDC001153]
MRLIDADGVEALTMRKLAAALDIQPEDPFWQGLVDILSAAELPESEIPRTAATLCAVFTGLLVSELTGALQRWSTLPPAPAGPDGEDPPPPSKDMIDTMFGCALTAAIVGVESHVTRMREGA